MSRISATFAALAALVPLAANAGPSVYLNGVNIDGVTGQKFDKCEVKIDEKGDIYITAKGYSVQGVGNPPPGDKPPPPPPPSAPVGDKVTHRYFLVTEQNQRDGTQFDVAVFINAKWIRDLKSSEEQIVTEITKHLHPGPNKVVLAATKRLDAQRHSFSSQIYFKVIIGEGNAGGDNVMIDNPLVESKRTAAETENVTEEFTLNAR